MSGAARLDQASDRMSLLNPSGLDNPPDPFAISAWVRPATILPTYSSVIRRYTAGGSGRGQIGTDEDGSTLMWYPSEVPFGAGLERERWCALGVSTIAGTVYTFARPEDGDVVVNSGGAGTVSGAAQITVGGVSVGNSSQWLDGRICCVRVWSAALVLEEFLAEWASPLAARRGNLWASWPLAADLLDESGNGRHLSPGATPVSFEDGPEFPELIMSPSSAFLPFFL